MSRRREDRQGDWTWLLVIIVCLIAVANFIKSHLSTFFSVTYGLAFFGLAFSLGVVILPYVFPKFRGQTGPLGENLLRLAAWGGETAAVFLAQSSEARMKISSLDNLANISALVTLFVSMLGSMSFLLLIDLSNIWTALSSARNRLPPRLVHFWWEGRRFFYILALLLLAISFAVSAGLFPR